MNTKLSLLAVSAFALLPFNQHASAQGKTDKPLSSYRDKNRILLVFAPSEKDASYQEQMKLWQSEKVGFEDRQLLVLPVFAAGKSSDGDAAGELGKRYGVDAKSFKVILIGKDGHDAYSSEKPVATESLYARIDAMPMRRDEMKRQNAKD